MTLAQKQTKNANANASLLRRKKQIHRPFNEVANKVADKEDFSQELVVVVSQFNQEGMGEADKANRVVADDLLLSVDVADIREETGLVTRVAATALHQERINKLTKKKFSAEYRRPRQSSLAVLAKERI